MKEKQAQPSICFGDDVMNQIRTDLFYYFVVVFFAMMNQELSRDKPLVMTMACLGMIPI